MCQQGKYLNYFLFVHVQCVPGAPSPFFMSAWADLLLEMTDQELAQGVNTLKTVRIKQIASAMIGE